MSRFNTTRADVASWLRSKGYDTDVDTAITDAINAAYRQVIGQRRWGFLEKTDSSLTTTAGTNSVSITGITGLGRIDAIRLKDGTIPMDLDWKSQQEIRDYQLCDDQPDEPQYWSQRGDTVLLWPTPDKAYTLVIDYISRTKLINDTDILQIPDEHIDVVGWGAVAELAYRQRDWQAVGYANSRFERELGRLLADEGIEQRQGGREVLRSSFWDDVAR